MKVSRNNTRVCYVLKCDVRKFFASIDQKVLMKILERHIADKGILWLAQEVVSSFYTIAPGIGLPLGNLTSQLFANVYMHELDMFVKQELRVKNYIRYADDFVVLSDDKRYLQSVFDKIEHFVEERLRLKLHNDKVYIKTYASGVDFLGWIHFTHHRQIRTSTKNKVLRNTKHFPKPQTINSYRGLLSHGNTYKVQKAAGIALYE
jgi:Reverse transcriptase (RNA-dependent DNA polymerase).